MGADDWEREMLGLNQVWVLDFEAKGPEPGDYVGYRSVHATREGATTRLRDQLVARPGEVDPADLDALGITKAADSCLEPITEDFGSFAGDFELDGVTISYGVHRMPVEP